MTVVQAVTARPGFAIDEVKVSGQSETSEIDILERLASAAGPRRRLRCRGARERGSRRCPGCRQAAVRKLYPDTLESRSTERKPFAIWQHGSELSLIDRERQA